MSGADSPKSEADFDKRDAAWKKMLADGESGVKAGRKLKEEAKKDFLDFEASKKPEIQVQEEALKEALSKKETFGWIPFVGDYLQQGVDEEQAKVDESIEQIESKRRESIVRIADSEADIKAAEAVVEKAYNEKYQSLQARRVYKDGLAKELLAKSQAALKAAEVAYQAGKDDEAKKILADAGETFEQVGVFPDSKASAMSLPGRLYDLKKAIDTGTPYRSGDLSGTQYIVLGQSLKKAAPKTNQSERKSDTASDDNNAAVGLGIGAVVLAATLLFSTSTPNTAPKSAQVSSVPVAKPAVKLPQSYTDGTSPDVKVTPPPPPSNTGSGLSEADATAKLQEASRKAGADAAAKADAEAQAAEAKRIAEDERIAKERAAADAKRAAEAKKQAEIKADAEREAARARERAAEEARIAEVRRAEDTRLAKERQESDRKAEEAKIAEAKVRAEAERKEAEALAEQRQVASAAARESHLKAKQAAGPPKKAEAEAFVDSSYSPFIATVGLGGAYLAINSAIYKKDGDDSSSSSSSGSPSTSRPVALGTGAGKNMQNVQQMVKKDPSAALKAFLAEEGAARKKMQAAKGDAAKAEAIKELSLAERNTNLAREAVRAAQKK